MEILSLNTKEVNQNGYHFNRLTKNKIGMIFTAPVDYVPEDCLACDGYVLKISDYKKLYSIIQTKFNDGTEAEDEFRIPDYNITKLFLQAGSGAGTKVAAGLPQHTHSGTTSSNGAHTHTRGSMEITGNNILLIYNEDFNRGNITGGALYTTTYKGNMYDWSAGFDGDGEYDGHMLNFKASNSWTGSTSSNGAHTHTMTTGNASNTTYGGSTTVQPPSQIVHLCIKYK